MTSWAATGDPRLLAYENALHLSGMLADALAPAVEAATRDRVSLDDEALVIDSISDVVLGVRGRRRGTGRVGFTYRQVMEQAETLKALMPAIAAEAHNAKVEHEQRARQ